MRTIVGGIVIVAVVGDDVRGVEVRVRFRRGWIDTWGLVVIGGLVLGDATYDNDLDEIDFLDGLVKGKWLDIYFDDGVYE